MSVIIRLSRGGTKKKPFYHLVVADHTASRDGRYLEQVGIYDPKLAPGSRLKFDSDKLQAWIKKGARPSETVGHLLRDAAKSK